MASASTVIGDAAAGTRLALAQIGVPANVRDLDEAHVDALARSIDLQGLLVPVIVWLVGEDRFELVAGFHRFAAVSKLGHVDVAAVIRAGDTEHVDRAVENIARKQLNAHEETIALGAALDCGLSPDGAAQALGWSKQRVSARMKLRELPERAQRMLGDGRIALACVDTLAAIGVVSPALLEQVVAYVADERNDWAAEQLASDPGRVLGQAVNQAADGTVFAAYLNRIDRRDVERLRLGKTAMAHAEQILLLERKLDRYAYGSCVARFSEADRDQARAAGVLIEFDHGWPIICDRDLYRQLAKNALKRSVAELEDRVAAAAAAKTEQRNLADAGADPVRLAARERDAALRAIADRAHGANLDLGAALIGGLSTVDPASVDVARFFVYSLLGPDHDTRPYMLKAGERVRHLAACGVRLVVEELREDVTKTRKDGTRGRLRIDYGDPRTPDAAIAWMWRYLDGAKTAGELYGRALVVIAAERHASRLVVPVCKRGYRSRWSSRKDTAEKALKRIIGGHVPASIKSVQRAVERAHRDHADQVAASAQPEPDQVERPADGDDLDGLEHDGGQ